MLNIQTEKDREGEVKVFCYVGNRITVDERRKEDKHAMLLVKKTFLSYRNLLPAI